MKLFFYIMLALFGAALCWLFYELLNVFHRHQYLKEAWEKSLAEIDSRYQSRRENDLLNENLYGEMEKKTYIARLDAQLAYGGIYSKFNKINLTAEKFAVAFLIENMLVFIFSLLFWKGNFLYSLVFTVFNYIFFSELLTFIRSVRNKRIDDETLHLMEIMELNASTNDDIIKIMELSASKVHGPLGEEVQNAVNDAAHGGNISQALRRLCDRVESKFLKDLFMNLDTCCAYKANYEDVISACKKLYMADEGNRKKLSNMYKGMVLYILILSSVILICLNTCGSLFAEGDANVFVLLWSSGIFGQIIVLYMLMVFILGLWRAVRKAIFRR